MYVILVVVAAVTTAFAQSEEKANYVEVRGGYPYYEYEEYSRRLGKGFIASFVHVKEEGEHEFSLGIGKSFNYKEALVVTPIVFATFGSHGQKGITVGTYVEAEKDKWKARAYISRFINVSGKTEPYTSMDIGDVTRAVSKRYDIGLSTTFFCQHSECDVKTGPLVRRNDKLGAWEVSYRFGKETNEFRVSRTFSF